jgi:hypothetical protein
MTRNGKIFLGCLAGLLLLCVCGVVTGVLLLRSTDRFLTQTLDSSPEHVAGIAAKIAEFELPDGYSPDFGMSFLGMSTVSYSSYDSGGRIMLMQFPATFKLNRAAMEQQLRRATLQGDRNSYADLEVVGESEATIRGEEVKLTISEGTNYADETYRQISGVFRGKGGLTLLVVQEPDSTWDQETIDTFLASIR